MKKILCLILMLILTFSIATSAAVNVESSQEQSLNFSTLEDKNLIIDTLDELFQLRQWAFYATSSSYVNVFNENMFESVIFENEIR